MSGKLISRMAARINFGTAIGNHEWGSELPSYSFTSFTNRYRTPGNPSRNASRLYFSLNYGMAHVLFLQGYCPEMRGSLKINAPNPCLIQGGEQSTWITADLASVDRKLTPWVVAVLHQPFVNTNTAHSISAEGLSVQMVLEDVLNAGGVDLVISGHVHSYERSARVYNYSCNATGPVYLTVGDGGNREGLASKWVSPQAEWSLFRQASFGHGEVTAVNNTHLLWEWFQNSALTPEVADSHWLVKGDPGMCGNGTTGTPVLK